jgi:hypothetical protein
VNRARSGSSSVDIAEDSGARATNWFGSPWRFLFEFRAADTSAADTSTRSGGPEDDDVDEDEDVDADMPETPEATTTDATATEGDESGSQRPRGRDGSSRKLSHQCVPKNTNLTQCWGEIEKQNITTLMIRNIPNLYTRSMLMEELDSLNFNQEYDFIYLPIDKSTQWNVGYAFVNFVSSSAAMRCINVMPNYQFHCFEHGSNKVAQISIAHIQGLERNSEYYSNTAVQAAKIQSHRPLVLAFKSCEPEAGGGGSARKSNRRKRRLRLVKAEAMQGTSPGQDGSSETLEVGFQTPPAETSLMRPRATNQDVRRRTSRGPSSRWSRSNPCCSPVPSHGTMAAWTASSLSGAS